MKIRSICAGVILTHEDFLEIAQLEAKLVYALSVINCIASGLKEELYVVQSRRICTNSFDEYTTTPEIIMINIGILNDLSRKLGLNCFSIGPAKSLDNFLMIPTIIDTFPEISVSAMIPFENRIPSYTHCLFAARVVSEIAKKPIGPLGNFRFCSSFCARPGIPFFPAAHTSSAHQTQPVSICIGLENSDLLFQAFYGADVNCNCQDEILRNAKTNFKSIMTQVLTPIQANVQRSISNFENSNIGAKIDYFGIDSSLNPVSVDKSNNTFETTVGSGLQILLNQLGSKKCLNIAISLLTSALHELQQLPELKLTGYNGVMLAVMEDAHLASCDLSFDELLYSSCFCGVGIDCVPIRYFDDEAWLNKIAWKMVEFGCICVGREGKQLTWRVFPVSGDEEVTRLDHPSLVNAKVFRIE